MNGDVILRRRTSMKIVEERDKAIRGIIEEEEDEEEVSDCCGWSFMAQCI